MIRLASTLPAALACLIASPSLAQDKAVGSSKAVERIVYPYPAAGVQIGQGWDSFGERGTASFCVSVDEAKLEHSSFESSVEQIQSTFSFVKKTTSSVSAAYNGGGGFGGSASASSSKEIRINSDDQNFLFTFVSSSGSTFAVPSGTYDRHISVEDLEFSKSIDSATAEERLVSRLDSLPLQVKGGSFTFSDQAQALLNEMSGDDVGKKRVASERFRQLCGDGFVAAIHRGARLHLLLTQKVRSRSQKESLTAAVSASGYGASGGGSFSSSTKKLEATDKLSYTILQEGGVPEQVRATIGPPTAGKVFDINDIIPPPENLLLNPTAFSVDILPYSAIVGPAIDQSLVASPNDLFLVGDYYIVLRDLFDLAGEAVEIAASSDTYINNSVYAKDMLGIYGGANEFSRLHDQIQSDMMFLERLIEQCYRERTGCKLETALQGVESDLKEEAIESKTLDSGVDAAIKILSTARIEDNLKDATSGKEIRNTQVSDALNEAIQRKPEATVGDALAYLKDVSETLRRYRARTSEYSSFIDDKGELSSQFYLRFYHYAANLPLPKDSYDDYKATIGKLVFPFVKPENKAQQEKVKNDFKAAADAATDDLRKAILRERLLPWKEFFCKELKSAPLCVPDAVLLSIATPVVNTDDFTIKPRARTLPIGKFDLRLDRFMIR
ncbi:hypothetical protein [Mesorhizobium sp. B2-8-5]|uniref:hypothetical protein n=1 Tax=Mesorhizobium sp. B2-8-5 TaxID=2589903 RepID=UPI00112D7BE3|nr:hypothetical protein [Mesorhizobium sp. B2-8-5]UCI23974.1 hypothetical protein FJ430_20465 [Mesorhizobium sp. B2-8-5]